MGRCASQPSLLRLSGVARRALGVRSRSGDLAHSGRAHEDAPAPRRAALPPGASRAQRHLAALGRWRLGLPVGAHKAQAVLRECPQLSLAPHGLHQGGGHRPRLPRHGKLHPQRPGVRPRRDRSSPGAPGRQRRTPHLQPRDVLEPAGEAHAGVGGFVGGVEGVAVSGGQLTASGTRFPVLSVEKPLDSQTPSRLFGRVSVS